MRHASVLVLTLLAIAAEIGIASDAADTPQTQPAFVLSGGTRLIYRAEIDGTDGKSPAQAMVEALKQRVGQPNVILRAIDNDKIEVLIPKSTSTQPDAEVAEVKRRLAQPVTFSFRIALTAQELPVDRIEGYRAELKKGSHIVGNRQYLWAAMPAELAGNGVMIAEAGNQTYALLHNSADKTMKLSSGGWRFKHTYAGRDPWGSWVVMFELDDAGGELFAKLTSQNILKPMAAVLDDKVISIATIQTKIRSSGQITGHFTEAGAAGLAKKLGSGSLSGSLKLVIESKIK